MVVVIAYETKMFSEQLDDDIVVSAEMDVIEVFGFDSHGDAYRAAPDIEERYGCECLVFGVDAWEA